MPEFLLEGDCRELLAALFKAQDDGLLMLGWTALSIGPASHDDLLAGAVRFQDYIMEGFVFYTVHAHDEKPGCRIIASGEGSNRDRSIRLQVRHFIAATRTKILFEDTVADDSRAKLN
jgi:hypothetical protein